MVRPSSAGAATWPAGVADAPAPFTVGWSALESGTLAAALAAGLAVGALDVEQADTTAAARQIARPKFLMPEGCSKARAATPTQVEGTERAPLGRACSRHAIRLRPRRSPSTAT